MNVSEIKALKFKFIEVVSHTMNEEIFKLATEHCRGCNAEKWETPEKYRDLDPDLHFWCTSATDQDRAKSFFDLAFLRLENKTQIVIDWLISSRSYIEINSLLLCSVLELGSELVESFFSKSALYVDVYNSLL